MRSMILISPNKNEIFLYRQWSNKAQNIFKDNDKLNMVLAAERIYIDYSIAYSITYSDKEIMKEFIQKSVFSKGSYIDNDLEELISLDEM